MAHIWSHGRRRAFIVLFAPLLLAAQEKTKWYEHYQDGAKAFAAGHYAQAADALIAVLQDAEAFPPLDLRRADTSHLLGMSYQFQGKLDRAEPLFLEAKRIREANGEAGRRLLGPTLDALAQL